MWGGAKGHLMAGLNRCRPDLKLVISDLSPSACAWAKSQYRLESFCGPSSDILHIKQRFNVITLIDVIYYGPRISKLWDCLPQIVTNGRTLINSVPNKLSLIYLHEFLTRLMTRRRVKEMSTQINYFNPEHLYVFSRKYLRRRLQQIGFSHITFLPSVPLIISTNLRHFYGLCYQIAKAVSVLSLGFILITTSFLVVARRP